MKFFITIIAFYLFYLALLPCGDGFKTLSVLCQDEKCTLSISTPDEESNDCSKDPCTPLCDCRCCSNMIYLSELIFFEVEEYTDLSLQTPHFSPQIEDNLPASDIWQPPKFC